MRAGLAWLESGPTPLNSRRVITPHPGEAARLLESTVEVVQTNRVAALREHSSRYGNCWSGSQRASNVGRRSNGEVYINPTGNRIWPRAGAEMSWPVTITGLLAQKKLQAEPSKGASLRRLAAWGGGGWAEQEKPAWTSRNWSGPGSRRLTLEDGWILNFLPLSACRLLCNLRSCAGFTSG